MTRCTVPFVVSTTSSRVSTGIGVLVSLGCVPLIGMGSFVVVLVPAHHQVDPVAVEQRQPVLSNAEIGAVGAIGRRHGGLMHAHHHPVDVAVLLRRLERRLQEALLRAARVAAHVRVPAVLVADVIVVQADDSYRAGGEGVPEPAQLGVGIRFWQSEVRLIGGVSDRSVASFVLVVARCGHPRPMARGAAVVVEPGRPRPDPIGGEVGVAQVTVDEIEQRGDALDAGRHVTRRQETRRCHCHRSSRPVRRSVPASIDRRSW